MKYWCCDPMNSPTEWTEVIGRDMDQAACVFAELDCHADAEMYSAYSNGHEVMVWDGQSMEAVDVYMETVPSFYVDRRSDCTEPTDEMLESARETSNA